MLIKKSREVRDMKSKGYEKGEDVLEGAYEVLGLCRGLFTTTIEVESRAEMEEIRERYLAEGYKVKYSTGKTLGLKKSYLGPYIILFVVLCLLSGVIGGAGLILGVLAMFLGALHGYSRRVYVVVSE